LADKARNSCPGIKGIAAPLVDEIGGEGKAGNRSYSLTDGNSLENAAASKKKEMKSHRKWEKE